MTPSEPFPTCRRKALWAVGLSLAALAAAWLGHAVWGLSQHWLGVLSGIGVGGLFAAVVFWFSPDMSDAVPKRLLRRYQREVMLVMAAYVAVMLVWKRVLDMVDATWLRVLVALFPALLVAACYLAAGFLQTAGLIDVPSKVAMLWVFPLLCLMYGITKIFVTRHYV